MKRIDKIRKALTRYEENTSVVICGRELNDIEKELDVLNIILKKNPYLYVIRASNDYQQYRDVSEDYELTEKEYKKIKEIINEKLQYIRR